MRFSAVSGAVPVLCWVVSVVLIGGSFGDKPTFRIIAPEFICNPQAPLENHPSNDSATSANGSVSSHHLTIGFQTNGGQRLRYRLTIYFTVLGDVGFISQRHTVGLWRAVRELEQRIRRDQDVLAQTGQMTIATDELLPGVVYSFGVVAVTDDGVESDQQNFTMTYRDVVQGASFEHGATTRGGDDVSLLMLGAEKSYADVEYSVTAQLIFCRRRIDYYFRWSLGEMNETEPEAVTLERSEVLRIPAGTLSPGRTYDIQVSVYSTSSAEEVIAKTRMTVTVLERRPEVTLFPVEAVVGIDQPVHIRSYGLGGSVVWSCQREGDEKNCDDTMDNADDDVTVTFHREGQYLLTASSSAELTEAISSRTVLAVHSRVTPSVRLVEWSRYPAVPGDPFELVVSVAGLVPNCSSNWTVLQEDGFGFFDPKLLPNGGTLGGTFVRGIDENFLSELVDYGNDTIAKDVTLSIPGSKDGSWKGLEADVLYKLRLETVCPEPFDDSKQMEQRAARGLVTSHWTFVLETNGAPRVLPLEVAPQASGTALETVFILSTGIAQDSARDYPLKYDFWYVADGVDINIATYYEITSTETVLPLTRAGTVGTYVAVCDSRGACSKVIGPEVRVAAGAEPSSEDVTFALDSIEGLFDRLNFRGALKSAFELLLTLRNRKSPQYDSSYRRFTEMLEQSITHIGKVRRETTYLSEATIQQFVMRTKPILDLEEASNHALFQQLLELIDPSSERSNVPRPKRLSLPSSELQSTALLNTKLSLMESLTVSMNASVARQARKSLLDFVHQATKNYCSVESRMNYAGQLITLEMTRHRSLSEVNLGRLEVSNNGRLNASAGRAHFGDAFPDTDYFCLGRVYYARDLFAVADLHELDLGFYEVFVLSVDKTGMWTLMEWKSDYFLWTLDGRRLPNVTCQLRENDVWTGKHCTTTETATDEVHCNCSRMAYLRITNETESDEMDITSTEPPTSPFVSETETTVQSTIATNSVSSTNAPSATSATTSLSTTPIPKPDTSTVVTVSDMLTLPSATASTELPGKNTAEPSQPGTHVDNGPSALLQGGNGTGRTSHGGESSGAASIGYTIIGAMAVVGLLVLILSVVYRRRKTVLRLADELHTVPSRTRAQSSPHVRYARFQDEHNMTGDNVSTISDVLTV